MPISECNVKTQKICAGWIGIMTWLDCAAVVAVVIWINNNLKTNSTKYKFPEVLPF